MEIDKSVGNGVWNGKSTELNDIAYFLYLKYRLTQNFVVSPTKQELFLKFMYKEYYDNALLIMRSEKINKIKEKWKTKKNFIQIQI